MSVEPSRILSQLCADYDNELMDKLCTHTNTRSRFPREVAESSQIDPAKLRGTFFVLVYDPAAAAAVSLICQSAWFPHAIEPRGLPRLAAVLVRSSFCYLNLIGGVFISALSSASLSSSFSLPCRLVFLSELDLCAG